MNLFSPSRHFDPNDPELIDQPGLSRALLREELQTLEKLNRQLGGHQLVLGYLQRFLSSTGKKSLSILDLGTGSADIPRVIVNYARQKQLPVSITAVDVNPEILQIAEESCRDWPEIKLERHDLRSLPYAAETFDFVLCSLVLHHFNPVDALLILQQIKKIARVGYIVNDLRRNWPAIFSTDLLVRIMIRSRVFRHDARQSCRAAFTIHELQELAEHAGLENFHIHRHQLFFRMVLEGKK